MKLNLFLVAFFFIVLIGSATAINDENRQLFKRKSSLGKSCSNDKDCAPDGGCSFEIGTCYLNNGEKCSVDGNCLGSICANKTKTCESSDERNVGDSCASFAACKSRKCDFSSGSGICKA
ncbi:40593_t:CDS:2 [Gigaspora margarita]|uniref:40593_t:CDS:1 n=2 Tax=Gigaspora margarita TaxID=4874 RepID=A0ABM8W2K4_GIGMA|nr:hypothetical protein F8M41_017905 [Gigaspora margarita]CAG8508589.1 40593_t:CDS:2 [Gigaspora margarita]